MLHLTFHTYTHTHTHTNAYTCKHLEEMERERKRKREIEDEEETRWDKERKIWEVWWNEFWIVLKEYSGLNNGFSIFSTLSNTLLLSLSPSSSLSLSLFNFISPILRWIQKLHSTISIDFHFTTFCTLLFQCFFLCFSSSSSTLTLELKFSIIILPPYSDKNITDSFSESHKP